MTYPEYDIATLPKIVKPFKSTQEVTTIYLGNRALTGEEYAELNLLAETDAQVAAFHEFWKTTLNYGTKPFLAPVPQFGLDYTDAMPSTVLKFIDNIELTKSADTAWRNAFKVKVLGIVEYIYDDALDYITDDSGDFIYTDAISNSNKEISYA